MRILTILLCLTACEVGQFGEEDELGCLEVGRDTIDGTVELTVDGFDGAESFVPQDALQAATGERTETLVWDIDGAGTEVVAELVPGGSFERVRYEVDDSVGGDVLITCGDRIVAGASLTLSTADGRLDEQVTVEASVRSERVTVAVVLNSPAGSIDPVALHTGQEPIQDTAVQLEVQFGPVGTADSFSGVVYPVHETGPDEDVVLLGHWPELVEEEE